MDRRLHRMSRICGLPIKNEKFVKNLFTKVPEQVIIELYICKMIANCWFSGHLYNGGI